jgi:hypothetical protein
LRKEKREFIGKAEPLKETRNKKIKPAKGIVLTSDLFLSGWKLFQWKRTKTERNKICMPKMKLMISFVGIQICEFCDDFGREVEL